MITETDQRTPGHRPARAATALVAALLTASALSACEVTLDATPPSSSSSPGRPAAEPVDSSAPVKGPSGSALAALDGIRVKGRAPTTGYSRDEFGSAWKDTDHNGCDQRNDVLRRDLTDETIKAKTKGCIVMSGVLVDPYTGKTIKFRKAEAAEVQIDHVVALQNAWVTGAFAWTEEKRTALATDPLNLLAVDGPTNSSKGAGDAATWLPPHKVFRCAYVARQVAVKIKYGAWMTSGEHQASEKVLSTCPKEKLPQGKTIPRADDSKATDADKQGATKNASGGAFCSPVGAKGVSEAGTKMVCSSKNGDPARWRADS